MINLNFRNIFNSSTAKNVSIEHYNNQRRNYFTNSKLNGDVDLDTVEQKIAGVFAAISILSNNLARLPIKILKPDGNGGKVDVKDIALYDVLHYNSNEYTNSYTFFNTLEVIRNKKGNSFAYIRRSQGEVIALDILPSDYITNAQVVNGQLYYIAKDSEVFNSFELLHFKHISNNGLLGLSPIEALRVDLNISSKAQATVNSFYSKNAASTKALKTINTNVNNTKLQEAVERWESEYGGVDNAGRLISLPVNTELQELSLSVEDAKFLESVKFSTHTIASVFGVPAYMLGHSDSKYSSIEQQQLNFKINTMANITTLYRRELEFKLLSNEQRKEGYSIEFNLNALLESDITSRSNYYKSMHSIAAINANEIRNKEGLTSYEGGDNFTQQAQYKPVNLFAKDKDDNNDINNIEDSNEK